MVPLRRLTVSLLLTLLIVPLDAAAASAPLPRRVLRHFPASSSSSNARPVRKATGIPKITDDMTRASFVSSLMEARYPRLMDGCFERLSSSRYTNLFPDVPRSHPHAAAICVAIETGVVQGYPDGLFRPAQHINAAEAAKVIAKAYGIAKDASDPSVPWYAPSVAALRSLGITFDSSLDVPFPYEQAKRAVWTVRCSRAIVPSGKKRSTVEDRAGVRSGNVSSPCP